MYELLSVFRCAPFCLLALFPHVLATGLPQSDKKKKMEKETKKKDKKETEKMGKETGKMEKKRKKKKKKKKKITA